MAELERDKRLDDINTMRDFIKSDKLFSGELPPVLHIIGTT